MADTINQVRNEGFKSLEQLEKALQEKAVREVQKLLTDIKEIEKYIDAKKQMMENRYIIEQYKEIHKYAKENPEDKAFLNEYGPQIMLYKKAVNESFQSSDVLPTTKQIYEDLEKLHPKKSLSLRNSINPAKSRIGYISIRKTMIAIWEEKLRDSIRSLKFRSCKIIEQKFHLLKYPPQIKKLIYTINAIENFN